MIAPTIAHATSHAGHVFVLGLPVVFFIALWLSLDREERRDDGDASEAAQPAYGIIPAPSTSANRGTGSYPDDAGRVRLRRPRPPRDPARRDWIDTLVAVAVLSASAAAIHLAVTPEHFEESNLYGGFFVGITTAQLTWTIWVLRSRSRVAYVSGLLGNAMVLLVWAVTRTTGIPLGPEAGEVEALGAADGLAAACQTAIVIGCLILLWGPPLDRPIRLLTGTLRPPLLASVVTVFTAAALLFGHS